MLKIEETLTKLSNEPKYSIRYQNKDNKYITNIYILREAFNIGEAPIKVKIVITEV